MEAGLPPLAVILRRPSHKEYTAWDIRLIVAYEQQEQIMRGSVPIYWDESDRVAFDVKTGISKSRRAIQQREERDSKAKGGSLPGIYYYPVARTIDGGPMPTMEEWLAERNAKQGKERGGPQAR